MEFQDILDEATKPHIASLDFSAFSDRDIFNTVLQRSQVLHDQHRSGQIIRSWSNGDKGPLDEVVERMGVELVARAAAANFLEYKELQPILQELGPKKIADIGCGYGFFDYFAARDLDAEIVLIDLEENDSRHFGFQEVGAAYSSLSVAKAFLVQNGIEAKRVKTVNPTKSDVGKIKGVDLATSFLSCGFHYPLSTYGDFFGGVVGNGGAMIVDVRLTQGSEKDSELSAFGQLRDISAIEKRRRVLVS